MSTSKRTALSRFADPTLLKKLDDVKVFEKTQWFTPGTYIAVCTDLECWAGQDGTRFLGWKFKVKEAQSTGKELDDKGNETTPINADPPGSTRGYALKLNDKNPKSGALANLIGMLMASYGWSMDEAKENWPKIDGAVSIILTCASFSEADIERYIKNDNAMCKTARDKLEFDAIREQVLLLEEAKAEMSDLRENVVGSEFDVLAFKKMKKDPKDGSYTIYRFKSREVFE